MKIITTTSVFPPAMDPSDILPRLKAIGFDGLDIAFDYCDAPNHPFMSTDYRRWADTLREKAAQHHIALTHSHASFDAAGRGDIVSRTMDAASRMGIDYVVVHPIFRDMDGSNLTDADAFIHVNKEAYLPILAEADKYGVTVLTENLLWGASVLPKAIDALVSEINSSNFGWCFDTGHANQFGHGANELLTCRNVPLSLHIQDNHGIPMHDEHLMPGDGVIDWEQFLNVLKQIGYQGEFVLEAHHQTLDAADEDRDAILSEMLARSRKMTAYYTAL